MFHNGEIGDEQKVLEWWQAILLAVALFFLGILVLAGLSLFLHQRVAALIMELCVYFLPAAVIVHMLKLRSAGVARLRRLANLRLIFLIPVAGVGWAAAVTPLVEAAHSIYPIPKIILDSLVTLMMADTIPEFIWVVFLIALVPAIAEELVFRGIVQPALIARFGPIAGIGLTSLVFAAIHLNPWSFGPLLILGTFFGIVSYKIGTFWAGALAHFGNNLLALTTLNCIRAVDYASLTETTPWYIFVPGLIAAIGGTLIIARRKSDDGGPTDEDSDPIALTNEPVDTI